MKFIKYSLLSLLIVSSSTRTAEQLGDMTCAAVGTVDPVAGTACKGANKILNNEWVRGGMWLLGGKAVKYAWDKITDKENVEKAAKYVAAKAVDRAVSDVTDMGISAAWNKASGETAERQKRKESHDAREAKLDKLAEEDAERDKIKLEQRENLINKVERAGDLLEKSNALQEEMMQLKKENEQVHKSNDRLKLELEKSKSESKLKDNHFLSDWKTFNKMLSEERKE